MRKAKKNNPDFRVVKLDLFIWLNISTKIKKHQKPMVINGASCGPHPHVGGDGDNYFGYNGLVIKYNQNKEKYQPQIEIIIQPVAPSPRGWGD